MPQAEQIVHCQNMLGEGPLWHPQEKKLYWLDILGKKVQCYDPRDGAQESFSLDEIVSVIALREKGSFVAAGENGFSFWDGSSPRVEHIHDPEAGKQGARFNDGKVDRAGRFWAGTMTRKGASSALYRLDADLQVETMQQNLTISNGIGWSPDNKTMYHVDTLRLVIFAHDFDLQSGTLSYKRPLVRFDPDEGVPDGLTVEAEGCIWCALWGGWRVMRFSPDGETLLEVMVAVSQPSSCIFGGEDLGILFITSAREDLRPANLAVEPLAGDLFAYQTGVQGLTEPAFKG